MAQLFFQRLSSVGDGTGTTNMNVDGSSAAVTFKISPAAGETMKISRIMIYVEDAGTFDAAKWGNGVTLTNGFNFKHKKDDVTTDMLGFGVKTSGDMASVCHDLNHNSFGTGNEFASWRWTFTKAGDTVTLNGDAGDEFQVVVNDLQTGLVAMYVMAQGEYL